jgi:predicted aspartyl protease
MRVPSVVAYVILLLAMGGIWRYTSIGVDRTPVRVDCVGETCGPHQPVALVRAEASPRHLLVPVDLEGHRLLFLVDTGAAASVLSRQSADRLGLSQSARPILGAANASFQIQRALSVSRFAVGDLMVGGFDLLIVDISGVRAGLGPDVDGVLGVNVLGLQPFEIDFGLATLTLGRTDGDFSATRHLLEIDSRQDLEELSGGWFVRARADGREGFFLIDSGANATQIGNTLAAHSVRVSQDAARSNDATGTRTQVVRRLELESLAVGKVVRRNLRVNVSDPSLLGADFFDTMLLRVDPQRGEMVLRARTPAALLKNLTTPQVDVRVSPTRSPRM